MKENGQLHVPYDLLPLPYEKEPLVFAGEEAGLAPEPLWIRRRWESMLYRESNTSPSSLDQNPLSYAKYKRHHNGRSVLDHLHSGIRNSNPDRVMNVCLWFFVWTCADRGLTMNWSPI